MCGRCLFSARYLLNTDPMHSSKAAANYLPPPGGPPTPGQSGACYGRETDLDQLQTLLDRAGQGGGSSLIVLSGKAGIGKSTLISAARQRFQAADVFVLEGWCSPGKPTHAPILQVAQRALEILERYADPTQHSLIKELRQGFAILQGDDETTDQARVAAPGGLVQINLSTLRPSRRRSGKARGGRIPVVRNRRATQPERMDQRPDVREICTSHLSPEARRISLFEQLAALLQMLSERRPLAIFLHDLDHADPGTLDLVRFLGTMLAPAPALAPETPFRGMFVLSCARYPAVLQDPMWAEQVQLVSMELTGLTAEAVQRYLASGEVVSRALEATGGNPRLLQDLIRGAAGRLSTAPTLDQELSLEPDTLILAQLLAVAGRPLAGATMGTLSGLGQRALSRAVGSLSTRGVVAKSFSHGELLLAFAQASDQNAIYGQIPPAKRRELHLLLADHLTAQGGDRELEACAEHMLRADVGSRAVEITLRAGERLEIALSFSRAAEMYERALPHAKDHGQRESLLVKLASLREMTGDLDRALAHAMELQELCCQDPEVGLRVANIQLLRDDHQAADLALTRVEVLVDAEADQRRAHVLRAQVLSRRAEVYLLRGDANSALETALTALTCCEDLGQTSQVAPLRISLLNSVGKLRLTLGQGEAARQDLDQALSLAREAGRVDHELRALGLLGQVEMSGGAYAAAEAWYQQARTLAKQVGEHRLLGVFLQHLGVLAERRRDHGAALEHYQQAVGAFKRVGHRAYLAWVAVDLGKLYLDLGDVDRARAMFEMSSRLTVGERPVAAQINLELLAGRVALRELKVAEARACFERARCLAVTSAQPDRVRSCVLALAELELQRGEPAQALALLAEDGAMPESGAPLADAITLLIQAELQLGMLDEAEGHLVELVALADTLDDREAAWQAPFLLAMLRGAQGRGAERQRLLRQAARREARTLEAVPEHLRESLGDQPLRVALRLEHAALSSRVELTGQRPGQTRGDAAPARGQEAGAPFEQIIGEHPRLLTVLRHVVRVGPTNTTVLIRGESGTGKELIARAIHRSSKRKEQPMVAVNCGALVESLLLSELFGHEKGAFTGAAQRHMGRFEVAEGGTIFLDEIGDVSPRTQAALLRVLQEREVTRVGGTHAIKVDVRVVCATNRDLEGMVSRGEFREDLYYRLRGVQLRLPALRERAEDIPTLAHHFLEEASQGLERPLGLTPRALDLLGRAPWAGNIRELKNVVRSAALLSDRDILDVEDLVEYPELATLARADEAAASGEMESVNGHSLSSMADVASATYYQQVLSSGLSLKEFKLRVELQCIEAALNETGGNITRAAKLLGIKRPRLSQIIKEHGLALN